MKDLMQNPGRFRPPGPHHIHALATHPAPRRDSERTEPSSGFGSSAVRGRQGRPRMVASRPLSADLVDAGCEIACDPSCFGVAACSDEKTMTLTTRARCWLSPTPSRARVAQPWSLLERSRPPRNRSSTVHRPRMMCGAVILDRHTRLPASWPTQSRGCSPHPAQCGTSCASNRSFLSIVPVSPPSRC